MTQLLENNIRLAPPTGKLVTALLCRIAAWLCACSCVSVALFSQVPANLRVTNMTITTGTSLYQATSSVTGDSNFTVSGSASVTFQAGNYITLGPGFHATAGSAQTTFHASITGSGGSYSNLTMITIPPLPDASVASTYWGQFVAASGTRPYNWTIVGASIPGLNVSTGGVLSGTPTSQGSYSFTVQVTDSSSATQSASRNFTLSVLPAGGFSTVTEYIRLGERVIAIEVH